MKAPSMHDEGLPPFAGQFAGAGLEQASASSLELSQSESAAKQLGAALDLTPAAWRGGFSEARRHSMRVKLLRGTAAAASILAIVLITGIAVFDPLHQLPVDFSVKRVGLDGTKVTVDFPKITGVQNNGRPFEIKARSGIQDVMAPNITELMDIESSLGSAESSTSWVSAAHGVYDSATDKLILEGDVRIKSSTGYDILLRTARVDFKSGGLLSDEPVKVVLEGGTVDANELNVSDNGHKVSFGGDVISTIDNAEEEPSVKREMAEGRQ